MGVTVMRVSVLLAALASVSGCSNAKCECQKGYKPKDYGYRTLCYKRYTTKATYRKAQTTCQGDKAKFPYVNSPDVLNFKQWRDWRGLPLFGMDWYKDNVPEDEELSITNYAYIANGKFNEVDSKSKQQFTCQYVINCKPQR